MKTSTFLKLNKEIYKNAFRLFKDACILYKNKSYPSAYVLAILSFEELGKLVMVAHICDDMLSNPQINIKEWKEHLFSKFMFFSHRNKQYWAIRENLVRNKKRGKIINSGLLEKHKQNAIYVGYEKNRITSPSTISKIQAYKEIKHVLKQFKEINDLAFTGLYYDSTSEGRRKAKRRIIKLETFFNSLEPDSPSAEDINPISTEAVGRVSIL